ncbi:MAG: class I SAM-dependent methyltransferase [Deltaproteobacteria bacterium]|nr:class I SAM-dependent methyltransferase [Deltaproteobacteria bacterium]
MGTPVPFKLMRIGPGESSSYTDQSNYGWARHGDANIMSVPHILSSIISEDVRLNLVEPNIYSVYPIGDTPGSYDSIGASTIYDVVACNRFYNLIMWGYSIKDYATLCKDSLVSSPEGWVLDVACGSLAFTAGIYADCSDRPMVFLDQSIKLLRKAKSRLEKLNGNISKNMFFLHADALQLPFRANVFHTAISLNLLHCLCMADVKRALKEIQRVLTKRGNSAITTLVQSSRWSDRYLNMLAGSGALISRSSDDLLSAFNEMQMQVTHEIKGNLAFIKYG